MGDVSALYPVWQSAFQNYSGLLTGASGSFTVPSGVVTILVVLQGAGGGGGGISAAAATGAGGTGGESITALYSVTPGQVIAYTNGAGGTGGAAGANNGGSGANAVFGAITAAGGLGGTGSSSGNGTNNATLFLGNRKGTAPSATFQIIGSNVANSAAGLTGVGGLGAPSLWAPATQGTLNSAGTNATGYGGGGSGAGSATATSAMAGGNGSPSAIAVWW